MSQLTDFISTNRLDHDETFCIVNTDRKRLHLSMELAGLHNIQNYTVACWDESLPDETKSHFDKHGKCARHIYSLFTGPFTENTLKQILNMAFNDDEVWALADKYKRESEEKEKQCSSFPEYKR